MFGFQIYLKIEVVLGEEVGNVRGSGGISGDFGRGMRRSDSFVLCSSCMGADWICFVGISRQILRLEQ